MTRILKIIPLIERSSDTIKTTAKTVSRHTSYKIKPIFNIFETSAPRKLLIYQLIWYPVH